MATAIDIATTGYTSGTPLTTAPIAVAAGVEEAITFTNWRGGKVTLVVSTDGTDVTYGFATGNTGGKLHEGPNYIESGGNPLFINSAAGANVWIRVF